MLNAKLRDMKMEHYFNNRYYTIDLSSSREGTIIYNVRYKGKNGKTIVGVVDDSKESIFDYIEGVSIFSRNKRHGKTARRWLNKNLRPYFNNYEYYCSVDDLFSGKIKMPEYRGSE